MELDVLFEAMAQDDEFLFDISKKVILASTKGDVETILFRQQILKDCLNNSTVINLLYDISVGAIDRRRHSWFGVFTKSPSSILSSSVGMMEIYAGVLKELRNAIDENVNKFQSEGFRRLFSMLQTELSDAYFEEIQNHLDELKFRDGLLISYQLGKGNKAINSRLHRLTAEKLNWLQRLFSKKPPAYTFYVHPRDESGVRALSDIKDKAINEVANALAQSNDHILQFFTMLRTELAFYVACLNLHRQLEDTGGQVCFPEPAATAEEKENFEGLYDICLALKMKQRIVGNDAKADHKGLTIITGANQGGKSTFLRSIGLSQIMMQAGMFVGATHFSTSICNSIFTHFKREEDTTMKSGKFDEELSRMSRIADHIIPNSMFLFNESFAATNEREGSEIAGQIVKALQEKGHKVFFVTHLYDFAHNFFNHASNGVLFLRAERHEDAARTFKLSVGEPLSTSYGLDIYKNIFGNE
ncbi:MAG TPA: hypothetical protein VMI12_00310 [Puia sp.]|nr:hypothetical protein [Puia sp.]